MDPLYLISLGLHVVRILIAGLVLYFRNKLSITVKASVWSFVAVYSFVMYGALAADFYFDYQLQKFDLNGDVFFSGAEINQEQEKAMDKFVGDTGRTFAPFTGLMLSIIFAGILFIVLKLGVFIKTHLTKT